MIELGDGMVRVAICDDDGILLEKLNQFVQTCYAQNRIFARVDTFLNGQQLLYEIEDGGRFDLALLDIEMPQMGGMELAEYVKKALPGVLIIFITSHMEYVLDAYELSVFRYIPKRGFENRLRHALLDAAAMVEVQLRESYVIQSKNRLERIPLRNLLYITHEGKNAVLVTDMTDAGSGTGARFHVRKTLQQVYEELGEDGKRGFFRTAKQDRLHHGWGLKRVRQVVQRYNGSLACEVKEGKFVAAAMLCMCDTTSVRGE